MTRTEVLTKASERVSERSEKYGKPESNLNRIASLWGAYLDENIGAEDVAAMMILLKVARLTGGYDQPDTWVDIAGYAACGGEVV